MKLIAPYFVAILWILAGLLILAAGVLHFFERKSLDDSYYVYRTSEFVFVFGVALALVSWVVSKYWRF